MKLKKLISIIFLTIVLVSLSFIDVNARKQGGKLINGPRNILYTVTPDAQDFVPNINAAVRNWMYTGWDNPIYMQPVSSTVGSTIDIYSIMADTASVAETYFFNSENRRQNFTSNYWYTVIMINDLYKYDYSINHDAVMAHEFGHVLGLDENCDDSKPRICNARSIMYPYSEGHKVSRPQYIDNEEVVELYGRY